MPQTSAFRTVAVTDSFASSMSARTGFHAKSRNVKESMERRRMPLIGKEDDSRSFVPAAAFFSGLHPVEDLLDVLPRDPARGDVHIENDPLVLEGGISRDREALLRPERGRRKTR